MDISQQYPLSQLDLNDLTAPHEQYLSYFKYYGIDFAVPHYFGYIPIKTQSVASQFKIACHLFLPEHAQGSVFIVHGLYDHVGLYKHVIEHALAQNLAVFAFDLPGHGLSSGERASIEDFSQYTDVLEYFIEPLQNLMPKPWHVVAQSTGASVVVDFLQRDRTQNIFATHAFFAPLVRPYLWPLYSLQFNLLKNFLKKQKRRFRQNSYNAEFIDFLHNKDPLQPKELPTQWVIAMQNWFTRMLRQAPISDRELLIFQGDKDKTIDRKFNTKVLLEKFPGSKLLLLNGAEHHLVNERKKTRDKWSQGLTQLWDGHREG